VAKARELLVAAACWLTFSSIAIPAGAAEPSVSTLLRLGGRHVKWGLTAYGSGAAVTYAFLDHHRSFPGARNCRAMRPLDALLQANGIAPAAFVAEVRAAFAVWSAAAAVSFTEIANPLRADIVIGAQAGSDGAAFTNIVDGKLQRGLIGAIDRATVCLDAKVPWELEVDGDPKTYNVRYVVAHEIGHAIGLDHAGRARGLMGFAYLERMASKTEVRLAASDIDAVTELYGPARRVVAQNSAQTPAPE
jgi:hypothetical protein